MNQIKLAVLFVAAMFAQWWLSSYFLLLGVAPCLLLVLTVVVAARLGPIPGMCLGFGWGLFLDVLSAQLFGANALVYTLVAYGAGAVRRQIDVVGIGPQAVTVFVMTWGALLLNAILGLIFMRIFLFTGWKVFFLTPLYDCLLVPLVYLFWERFMAVRR